MSFGQREKEQKWASDVMSVMLGWALHLIEMRYGEAATEEQVLDSYPMREFKKLYERGVELELLVERDGEAER